MLCSSVWADMSLLFKLSLFRNSANKKVMTRKRTKASYKKKMKEGDSKYFGVANVSASKVLSIFLKCIKTTKNVINNLICT